jgi:hypothetical protein
MKWSDSSIINSFFLDYICLYIHGTTKRPGVQLSLMTGICAQILEKRLWDLVGASQLFALSVDHDHEINKNQIIT